ncbi:ATP-dependent Clp protease adapter ClpS [bacterium]|nr:ATP-dependent Clp protease adapter ClpS [bacterium]
MSTEKERKEGTGHGVDLQDRQKVEPPSKYSVVLHNDDFTPMEFVIIILMDAFNYDLKKANSIMMQVHEKGKGIAGVYSKEIAIMKVKRCNQIARAEGHPLLITMEEQ